MKFPQIQMKSTNARIAIQTTSAQVSLKQSTATLDIQQPQAIINIHTTPGKLTIDQTQARADVDLKSVAQRMKDFADNGHSDVMEGIARRVEEGTEMMEIENKSNPIASQAGNHTLIREHSFNIGFVPSYESVVESYQPAVVDIEVKPQKVVNQSHSNPIEATYQPGDVAISLAQRNSLTVDVKGLVYKGYRFETEI